ncbi:hypothetical protein MNBD_GAMMA12-1798 [hydrothermal vent metagenome]|uniref:Tyr recombinase domain-containing protein n=1 Tax=hydrothermal vent metagenome TaxID=652676 RepID=A0A3B0Y958_9ZZZZ
MENKHWQDDFDRWIEQGTSSSTRRAYAHDVKYIATWLDTHFNEALTYPLSIERILQFCLFHIDAQSPKPLKLSTLRRYLVSLSVSHAEHGLTSPSNHPKVKLLLRRARLAKNETPVKKAAITLDILERLLKTCDDSLMGVRDKAILLVGFASGGRRRSELSQLQMQDLKLTEDGYLITIRKSKTDKTLAGHTVPLKGQAAIALKEWIIKSGIREGTVFRGLKPNRTFYSSLSGHSINVMVKARVKRIGLNEKDFGAHSLRAGFLTEATRQGINLTEAMYLSGHKSIVVAQGYCRASEVTNNKASQLT